MSSPDTPGATVDRDPRKEEDQPALAVDPSPASIGNLRHPNGALLGVGRHRIRISLQVVRRTKDGRNVYGVSIGISRRHFGGRRFELKLDSWPNARIEECETGLKASGRSGSFATIVFHGARCPFQVAQYARRFVTLNADWDEQSKALSFAVPDWARDGAPQPDPAAAELPAAVKLINRFIARGGRAEIFDGRLRVFVPTFEVIE